MNDVRIGLVGYGNIGISHAGYLAKGEVPGARLVAVCDSHPDSLKRAGADLGEGVRLFDDPEKLFASGQINAVLIATPHYDHPPLAIKAFRRGFHVLIEKPAGVYTKSVREMNRVAAESGKIFGIMFNQRTRPVYQELKALIDSGELGEIKRTNWITTAWYRPQSYYDSGGWRATWAGEGGGVLINQCPHQLDLWQWVCGMPVRVRAFCAFGKYHTIEVEDDVTAYVEYPNGATGVFIASTEEAPGSNRLEIVGDRGKIVVEEGKLVFWQNRVSERQFNREFRGGFGMPECEKRDIAVPKEAGEHKGITQNWVAAILEGKPLLAKGEEGLNSLELSNAMLLSTWIDDWVKLPIDDDLFYKRLTEKIEGSTFRKKTGPAGKPLDVKGTF